MTTPRPLRRLRGRGVAPATPSLWGTYWPMLRGRRLAVTTMAATAFAAGFVEATLLVLVAKIALTIGQVKSSDPTLVASLGPLGGLELSVPASFVVALALTGARVCLQLGSSAVAARLTATLTAEIRAGTFADFAAASWAEQSRRDEAEIQDLLLRHVGRATGAIDSMAQAIGMICTIVALLTAAVIVDTIAAALLVLAAAGLFLLVRPFSRVARKVAETQIVTGREYARVALEAIGTSLEMRSFGVSEQVSDHLRRATQQEVRPIRRAFLLKQVVATTYQTATVLLLLGGLLAVYTVADRPIAALGAIVVILVRSLNQAASLQSNYHVLTEIQPYIIRLGGERQRMRASAPRSGPTVLDGSPALRLESVSYSYDGLHRALVEVSVDVARGEAIGIIGPSGSGKSTLVQVLLRLREPDSGRYLVDGTEACAIDDSSWFGQVAFVPQDSRVINATVADNIAFYRRHVTRDDIVRAARQAHIHAEILAMPEGYDTRLGSRGGALSGGQRQRISIARALVRRPSILVLDEPTSALDMRSEALVHETLTELRGAVTIFAIAHRLSTLNTCDRIMVLGDGRLQAFGSRAMLEQRNGFYRDALRLSRIRE